MSTLNIHANNVLGEFGFLPNEVELSFEDVKRDFVRIRALELQKLGISDTDKTLTSTTLNTSGQARDALVGTDMIPAFAELAPSTASNPNYKESVEIVPIENIADYEGSRAIAFYGTPLRYRLSFDAWNKGTLTIYYDAVEDYNAVVGSTSVVFPPNFYIYLECKTALAVIALLRLKLVWMFPEDKQEQMLLLMKELDQFQMSKAAIVDEWQREFRLWKNKSYSENPRLRRTNSEIYDSGFGNTTGNRAFSDSDLTW